jgi:hypothetical protein
MLDVAIDIDADCISPARRRHDFVHHQWAEERGCLHANLWANHCVYHAFDVSGDVGKPVESNRQYNGHTDPSSRSWQRLSTIQRGLGREEIHHRPNRMVG